MKRGEKRVGIVGWLFTFIIGCGVYDGKEGPRMKLPPSERIGCIFIKWRKRLCKLQSLIPRLGIGILSADSVYNR